MTSHGLGAAEGHCVLGHPPLYLQAGGEELVTAVLREGDHLGDRERPFCESHSRPVLPMVRHELAAVSKAVCIRKTTRPHSQGPAAPGGRWHSHSLSPSPFQADQCPDELEYFIYVALCCLILILTILDMFP